MPRMIDAEQLKQQKTVLWDPALGFCDCVLVEDIDKAPAVNAVEVVHGRWISYLDGDSIMPERRYRCSECCDRGWGRKWPYCPNCGAKMDLEASPRGDAKYT